MPRKEDKTNGDAGLKYAVQQRKIITFKYDDDEKPRTVEPFIHGKSEGGKLLLRGFQVKGSSDSAEESGWKLFDVEKMKEVKITGRGFAPKRDKYNAKDEAMKEIYVAIKD